MTDKIPAMAFTWDAQNCVMRARDRRAAQTFDHDRTYRLMVREGRSQRSHDHFFACLEEVWRNLPEDQAERVAARIRAKDEYAIVLVQGGVVREYTAKSQSKKAMGPKVFQESKQAVLEAAAGMIGVSVEDLVRNEGRAA